jgi:hypothetical protein
MQEFQNPSNVLTLTRKDIVKREAVARQLDQLRGTALVNTFCMAMTYSVKYA